MKCTVNSTHFHCEHFFWNTQNCMKWKRAHPWWYSNPRPLDYIPSVPTAEPRECYSCWRHQMETVSALLAIFATKSPVAGESPAQKPVTPSFDVFFDLHPPNKRLSKQWWGRWFERTSRPIVCHCNAFQFMIWDTGSSNMIDWSDTKTQGVSHEHTYQYS